LRLDNGAVRHAHDHDRGKEDGEVIRDVAPRDELARAERPRHLDPRRERVLERDRLGLGGGPVVELRDVREGRLWATGAGVK
jgi:hypothetical protein